jgi:hypothetical protein
MRRIVAAALVLQQGVNVARTAPRSDSANGSGRTWLAEGAPWHNGIAPVSGLEGHRFGGIICDATADCVELRIGAARKEPLNIGVRAVRSARNREQCRGRRERQCDEDLGTHDTLTHLTHPTDQ